MNWNVLGIQETKDKAVITAAYRERLAAVNPEDKPEEFMELRQAYETAMQLAEQEEQPEEQGPLYQWGKRLEEIYAYLPDRLDVEQWKELLRDDVCQALDTREGAEQLLLQFLMEHYYMPQKVMIFLDEQFHFMERREELAEKYPKDFLEQVIYNNIIYGESLPLESFEPGLDGAECENYHKLYVKASRSEEEEQQAIFAQMQELTERHPLGELQILCGTLAVDDPILEEKLLKLAEKWPMYDKIRYELSVVYLKTNRFDECITLCDELIREDGESVAIIYNKANALAGKGDYEAAVSQIDILRQLNMNRHDMEMVLSLREQWNEKLMEQYIVKLQENPEDDATRYDYAWALMQNSRYGEALEQVELLPFEKPQPFRYHNILDAIYSGMERYEEALAEMDALITYVRSLKPEDGEEAQERIARLPELLCRKASAMWNLKMEGAMEIAEEACSMENAECEIQRFLLSIYHAKREHEKALALSERYIKQFPDHYDGYLQKAVALYGLRRDSEAYAALEQAMNLDASDIQEYLLKLQIFVRNNVKDGAEELIGFLEENGFGENLTVRWCKLWLTSEEKEELEQQEKRMAALTQLDIDMEEQGTVPDWAPDFYYESAVLLAGIRDAHEEYEREPLYRLLEKGLKANPEHYECLEYYGWLLKKDNQVEKAIEVYKTLEAYPRRTRHIELQLAELYYKKRSVYADKSLQYYKLAEEDQDNSLMYFNMGFLYSELGDPENAEKCFLKLMEKDATDVDSYLRLTEIYLHTGQIDKAREMADKSEEAAMANYNNPTKLLWAKIRYLQRAGSIDELMDYLYQVAKKTKFPTYYANLLDALVQAGEWKLVKKYLKECEKFQGKEEVYSRVAFMYHYLTGDLKTAEKVLRKNEKNYNGETWDDHWRLLWGATGNYIKLIEAAELKLQQALASGEDDLMSPHFRCAFGHWLAGNQDACRTYAEKILEDIERHPFHGRSELIYLTHKAGALGMLGRIQEAKDLLAGIRTMPLCYQCNYCTCKDADLFEAIVEGSAGNYARVRELIEILKTTGPDEDYGPVLEAWVNGKEKRK